MKQATLFIFIINLFPLCAQSQQGIPLHEVDRQEIPAASEQCLSDDEVLDLIRRLCDTRFGDHVDLCRIHPPYSVEFSNCLDQALSSRSGCYSTLTASYWVGRCIRSVEQFIDRIRIF